MEENKIQPVITDTSGLMVRGSGGTYNYAVVGVGSTNPTSIGESLSVTGPLSSGSFLGFRLRQCRGPYLYQGDRVNESGGPKLGADISHFGDWGKMGTSNGRSYRSVVVGYEISRGHTSTDVLEASIVKSGGLTRMAEKINYTLPALARLYSNESLEILLWDMLMITGFKRQSKKQLEKAMGSLKIDYDVEPYTLDVIVGKAPKPGE